MALREAAKARAATPSKAQTTSSAPKKVSQKVKAKPASNSTSLRGKAKARPKSKGSQFQVFGADQHQEFLKSKEKEDTGPVLPFNPEASRTTTPPPRLGWISSYATIPSLRRKGLNSGY